MCFWMMGFEGALEGRISSISRMKAEVLSLPLQY